MPDGKGSETGPGPEGKPQEISPTKESTPEKPVSYGEVSKYMRETGKIVNPLVHEAVNSIEDSTSREIIDYFFQPRYEASKTRPLVARLTFELTSDVLESFEPKIAESPITQFETVKKLGAAVRLLDGATFMHDDFLDHTPTRDGQPSVYAKYGAERTLIVGEVLRGLASQTLSQAIEDQEAAYDQLLASAPDSEKKAKMDVSSRIVDVEFGSESLVVRRNVDIQRRVTDIFDDIWHKVYIGQRLDHDDFGKDKQPTREENERRIYYLTGAFFEHVSLLGGLFAGLTEEQGQQILDKISEYGKYYGMAVQARNDLMDFAPLESFGEGSRKMKQFNFDDFKEGKQTLPLILAREACTSEEWDSIYQKLGQEISDEEKLEINRVLARRGVIKECQRHIFELSKRAIAAVEAVPIQSRRKDMLRVWALALNNTINANFDKPGNEKRVKLDDIQSVEGYFQ